MRTKILSKFLALSLGLVLLAIPSGAWADDPGWVTKFVPDDLIPFVSNTVTIVGGFKDISGAIEVTPKILEIVGILPKQSDLAHGSVGRWDCAFLLSLGGE
jgi:hypothetical protein